MSNFHSITSQLSVSSCQPQAPSAAESKPPEAIQSSMSHRVDNRDTNRHCEVICHDQLTHEKPAQKSSISVKEPDVSSSHERSKKTSSPEDCQVQNSATKSQSNSVEGESVIFVKSSTLDHEEDDDDDYDDEEVRWKRLDCDDPRSPPPPRPSCSPSAYPKMRHSVEKTVSFSSPLQHCESRSTNGSPQPRLKNYINIIRNPNSIWGDINSVSRAKKPEKVESPRRERTSHVVCSCTDGFDSLDSIVNNDVMPDNCWQRVQGSAVVYYWTELMQSNDEELLQFIADMVRDFACILSVYHHPSIESGNFLC